MVAVWPAEETVDAVGIGVLGTIVTLAGNPPVEVGIFTADAVAGAVAVKFTLGTVCVGWMYAGIICTCVEVAGRFCCACIMFVISWDTE